MSVMLKGIDTAEDAELAVQHGVDGLIVSNHGGRAAETFRPPSTACRKSSRPSEGACRSSLMEASGTAPTSTRRWRPARRVSVLVALHLGPFGVRPGRCRARSRNPSRRTHVDHASDGDADDQGHHGRAHRSHVSTKPAEIRLALKQPPPDSVDAGSAFSVSIVATWPQGGVSMGASYALCAGERVLESDALPASAEDESIALSLRAPDEVGEHELTLVVMSEKAEGAIPFSLTSVPHATSLAVWDVASPIVRSAPFEIKTGARCTSACALAGKVIEIRDEEGALMGSAALGDTPAPGTTALVFTTIALKAPRKCALHAWTASFAPSELRLPHGHATSRFSFMTVAEPEHSGRWKVVNKETKEPIPRAQVRLGVYRAETDDAGAAEIRVPKGKFDLAADAAGLSDARAQDRGVERRPCTDRCREISPEDPFALWSG